MNRIKVEKDNKIIREDCEVYAIHHLSVEPSDEFEVLARSEDCVEAVKHKTKPFYGLLFHPEVRHHEMIESFIWHLSRP